MDTRGLVDSKRDSFCVKALLCAFWFSLKQIPDFFLTQEGQQHKTFILRDIIHSAHIFQIEPINEQFQQFEPTELEFRTQVLWKMFYGVSCSIFKYLLNPYIGSCQCFCHPFYCVWPYDNYLNSSAMLRYHSKDKINMNNIFKSLR